MNGSGETSESAPQPRVPTSPATDADAWDSLSVVERRIGRDRAASLVEVVLCSGFPTQLLLAGFLGATGLTATGEAGGLSFVFVVTLTVVDAALVIGLIVYFLRVHGESVKELVLGVRAPGTEARLGLVLTPIAVLAAVGGMTLIGWLAPSLRNVPNNPLESLLDTPARAAMFAAVAIAAGGFREEFQRAFILRRFDQHLGGGWVGLAVFSVAFGLGHQIQGWDAAVVTGALGAAWGAIYLIRRSAIAPMVSHAGFNAAQILLALSVAAP